MKIAQVIAFSVASAIAAVSFAGTTTQPAKPAVPAAKTTTVVKTAPAAKPATVITNKKVTTKQTPQKAVVTKKVTTTAAGFKCKDGSISKAQTIRGACSGHGGIAK